MKFRQKCGAADCPPCAPTPTITGFACVSRTGSGNLRGWSLFQNFNAQVDWNRRKMTGLIVGGDLAPEVIALEAFTNADCTAENYFQTTTRVMQQLTALWNVAANSLAQDFDGGNSCAPCGAFVSFVPTLSATNPEAVMAVGSTSISFPSDWVRLTAAAGLGTLACSIGGCTSSNAPCGPPVNCPSGQKYQSRTSAYPAKNVTVSAISFDTVAAAQARGTPTVGSSCQTLPGTIGSTSARSTTQLAITNPTSVVSTITCGDLVNGSTYEITATLTRRASADNAFISTNTVTITFTADGTTDTVDYPVPVETGVKVNFDSADSIVAV
jgi:hypothetical protein